MSDGSPTGRRRLKLVAAVLAVLIVCGVLAVGYVLFRQFNPFVLEQPAVKAARQLSDVARSRPLTDEEFDRAVRLLGSGEPIAQLSAVAVLQLEGVREAKRRESAVVALEECGKTASPSVATAARNAATRLKGVK